jgi:hypothetical protein
MEANNSTSIFYQIDGEIQKLKNELKIPALVIERLQRDHPQLRFKVDENVCLLYHDLESGNLDPIEEECRSYIFDLHTMQRICNQCPRILCDTDAEKYIADRNWNSITVYPCYKETVIMVFYYGDKWYITTRKHLNAFESYWVPNLSFGEMFENAIEGKFELKDLNKNYCYLFALIHHQNRNVMSYEETFGKDYRTVIHLETTEKGTMKEVKNHIINDKVMKQQPFNFKNMEEVKKSLHDHSERMRREGKIDFSGYVLKVYNNPQKTPQGLGTTGNHRVCILHADLFRYIERMRPNHSNIYRCALELFQRDLLSSYLKYYHEYWDLHLIDTISQGLKALAREILMLYHLTRTKKNSQGAQNELYNLLPGTFRYVLYQIHGKYLQRRKDRTVDNFLDQSIDNALNNLKDSSSQYAMEIPVPTFTPDQKLAPINIHDTYHVLKTLDTKQLINLFSDRQFVIQELKKAEQHNRPRHPFYFNDHYIYNLTMKLHPNNS